MSSAHSVTHWIGLIQDGDPRAAQQLWERYFHRLIVLARRRLQNMPRRVADEEDVALNAFDSFCRGAEQGRFPQLNDRDNLWRLLLVITERKALDLIQYEGQGKRDYRKVQELRAANGSSDQILLDPISQEPDPGFAAQMAEQCQLLLDKLPDQEMRLVAVQKMEGCTNEEIAKQLDCALSTVERKLRLIRKFWSCE